MLSNKFNIQYDGKQCKCACEDELKRRVAPCIYQNIC